MGSRWCPTLETEEQNAMIRIFIGSIVAGLIQFIVGALAWATPLGRMAFTQANGPATADLQAALARNLTTTGTGTYFIPSPETAEGTVLLGKGPVALIHFNTSGFAPMVPGALLTGLIMSVATMLLVGVALSYVRAEKRLPVMLLFAVATVSYFVASLPVYNFYMPWGWWAYLAVESFIAFTLGAFVLLTFFMPKEDAAPAPVTETTLH
jgi:hypothetical protein